MPTVSGAMRAHLERSRDLGFLGPGPVDTQIGHAAGFATVCTASGCDTARVLDLGTGGGVPGLLLASWWTDARFVLLDSSQRRTSFLTDVVEDLGWSDRVVVIEARAETAGRDPALRTGQTLVVSRSFGPPGTTAECGAPFLEVGGFLVVSDPPRDPASPARRGAVADGGPGPTGPGPRRDLAAAVPLPGPPTGLPLFGSLPPPDRDAQQAARFLSRIPAPWGRPTPLLHRAGVPPMFHVKRQWNPNRSTKRSSQRHSRRFTWNNLTNPAGQAQMLDPGVSRWECWKP